MQISSCRLGNSGVLGLLLGNGETAVKLDNKFWFVDVGLSTSDFIWACSLFFFFFFFLTLCFSFIFFFFSEKSLFGALKYYSSGDRFG